MSADLRRRRRLPRVMSGVVGALVVGALMVSPAAHADHGDAAAKQAAREIQDARDRANAAAQALFDAESAIDTFTAEIAEAEQRLAAVEAEAADMRAALEANAIRRFTQAGGSTFVLLGDLDDAHDDLTAEVLASVTQQVTIVELDDFDAVMTEVSAARADLERRRTAQRNAVESFAALQTRAEEEIVRLTEIEEQRQIDEAVEHELERQRQERAAAEAAAAEAAAAQAAAARTAAQASGSSGGSSSGGGSTGGSSTGGSSTGGSTGGSSSGGGSTGGSSTGGAAAPSPPPPSAGNGMVCPVAGPHAFADTWGAPRSGGRSHQGVDMIASTGVTLVAVESGSVRFSTNRLGGNAAWVTGNSGTKYYYAHLNGFTGSSRSVSQGEQIGTVGSTGNAGTPHLHFEVHPGGGRAVNPYPYVRAVC